MSNAPQVPEAQPPPSRSRRTLAAAGAASKRAGQGLARRVDSYISARGPGFRQLAISHAASAAGDTMVAVALAGELFLDPSSADEARSNMVLYLLLTLAPFAVLSPVLASLFSRYPTAYRAGIGISSWLRALVAVIMIFLFDSVALFPLAFIMLVLSRVHGISRNSLVPVALETPEELVAANARMAKIGVVAGTLAALVAAGVDRLLGPGPVLILAAAAFVMSAVAARRVPSPRLPQKIRLTVPRRIFVIPRSVRLAELATAGVRFINGFLLLLLAFAFRDQDAGLLDFGALLGAAGLGYFLGAVLAPILGRVIREEPMVVAALAIEAAAAFIAAQAFGLGAAAALAAAAGLAWGVAKLGFDGLLQNEIAEEMRARAFVRAETVFQLVWVLGALLPTAITIPTGFGLAVAGVTALAVQIVYVAQLIVPRAEHPPETPRLPPA